MPSLVFLTAVLSLDVARVLVQGGYGLGYDTDAAAGSPVGVGRFTGATQPSTGNPYPPLAIVGLAGGNVMGQPIIVTTAYPHGVSTRGIGGMACIISGTVAADNISTNPLDRTVGLAQGVLARPVPGQPSQLALYAQDQTTGRIVLLTKAGSWSGGGTLTPALTDGQILLGRPMIAEQSAPPRIVLVPRTVSEGPDDMSMPNPRLRTAEKQAQTLQRALGSDAVTFDVHCWGQLLPVPDAAYDTDITFALSQAVKASSYLLFGQSRAIGAGTWDSEGERKTQLIESGRLLTFALTVDVPVLDTALTFVPSGAVIESVVQSPKPETAQVIDVTLS